MTLAELKKILDTTGYPVAYSHFTATATKPVPNPPYIVYLEAYSSNVKADLKVLKRRRNIQVELYTTKKDLEAESKLEQVFNNNGVVYDSIEDYLPTEKLFRVIYEFKI